MMKRKAAGPPAGGLRRLIRGRTPLKLIPALAACTAKRMKSCAFPSLHPMLAAPKAQAEDEKPRRNGLHPFLRNKKKPPHMGGLC